MSQITLSKKDNIIYVTFKDEYNTVKELIDLHTEIQHQIKDDICMSLSDFIRDFSDLHRYLANKNGGWSDYHKAVGYYISAIKSELKSGCPFYVTDKKRRGLSVSSICEHFYLSAFELDDGKVYYQVKDDDRNMSLPLSLDDAIEYIVYYGFEDMENDLAVLPMEDKKLVEISNGYKNILDSFTKKITPLSGLVISIDEDLNPF